MPIQLNWQPAQKNKINSNENKNLGLEISGDDTSIQSATDGRIKLMEVKDVKGQNENADRLIATFHGKFHRDDKKPAAERLTFEIFIKFPFSSSNQHEGFISGFDPECVLGVDFMVLTFVNREFPIFFPFHIDSRSEGDFLEIVAVAETGAANSPTEIGRSSVLNLPLKHKQTVDTTSNFGGSAVSYTANLIGHLILFHTDYLLHGSVKDSQQSTPTNFVLKPAFIPVSPSGADVKFAAYTSGSLNVILLTDLLDDVSPSASFLTTNVTGLTDAPKSIAATKKSFRDTIQSVLKDVFLDAGFTGANVLWQDETAAATLVASFTNAFLRKGGNWKLNNSNAPFSTPFWNYFVGSGSSMSSAGTGEKLNHTDLTLKTTVKGQEVFLGYPVPVGSGNKRVTDPITIASGVFQGMLTTRSGLPRTYKSQSDYDAAVVKAASKMAILIAHEVGHGLGLMHHCRFRTSANFPEKQGSPVLSLMSENIESGGFGVGMKFHQQIKVIWEKAFKTSPVFSDTTLQNKVWSTAEVFTTQWADRKSKFINSHGEGLMVQPGGMVTTSPPPPFASTPPSVQKGTFK